jgi:hypothetical protein
LGEANGVGRALARVKAWKKMVEKRMEESKKESIEIENIPHGAAGNKRVDALIRGGKKKMADN